MKNILCKRDKNETKRKSLLIHTQQSHCHTTVTLTMSYDYDDYNNYNNYNYLELNAIQRVSNLNNTLLIPILSSPNRNKHSNYFSHSITMNTITQIDV